MVVCRYFLLGSCHFGNNCKFEHQIGDNSQSHTSILRQQPNIQPANVNNIDINTLIRSVANDAQGIEKRGQWPFSCYAPKRTNFPGFEDKSFEEVRLGFYEAQKNGTLDQYKQQLQIALQDVMSKVRALQNPSPDLVNIIKNVYNTPSNSANTNSFGNSPFGSTQGSSSGGLFGNNQQQNQTFGTNQSVFNQNATQQPFTSQNSTSIFAQANQSLFGGNNVNSNNQQSSFGGIQQGNIFGQPNSNQNLFAGSLGQQNQVTNSIFSTQSQPAIPLFSTQNSSPLVNNTSPLTATSQFTPQTVPSSGSPFQTSFNTPPPQAFGAQTMQNSIFGQPPPPFPNQSATSVFGNNQQPPIFSNTIQNSFVSQAQNNPPQDQSPMFSNQSTNSGAFSDITPAASQPFQNQNINSNSNSVFSSNFSSSLSTSTVVNERDESFYSKAEDLTEDEVKCFESDSFEFGKIPEKPPTTNLCF